MRFLKSATSVSSDSIESLTNGFRICGEDRCSGGIDGAGVLCNGGTSVLMDSLESFATIKIELTGGDCCCGDATGRELWHSGGRFDIGRGSRSVRDPPPRHVLGMYAGGTALGRIGTVDEDRE
jgi:hypothetical protein